jgi:hypothetical protein
LEGTVGLDWLVNYYNLLIINVAWWPRVWYFRNLQYRVRRISLLRGGKFVKVETSTLSGDRNTAWTEIYNFHPLTQDMQRFDDRDNADFLNEKGQLKHELATQLDDFTEFGTNQQDIVKLPWRNLFWEDLCKGRHFTFCQREWFTSLRDSAEKSKK